MNYRDSRDRKKNAVPCRRSLPGNRLTRAARAAFVLIAVIAWSLSAAQVATAPQPTILAALPYRGDAADKTDPRQTLDLYLPPTAKAKPPLVAFIHGGFWTTADDQRIGAALAEELSGRGIAVALIRFRLAPHYRHPAQAQDAAAALAYLARKADDYGYDPKRIFLAGHSGGAHLAALIALDPAYLASERLGPQILAGVITLSGIYDLAAERKLSAADRLAFDQTFGSDPTVSRSASPIHHARSEAPPFLILSASSDFLGFHIDARRFADALRNRGHAHVVQFMVSGRDHSSIMDLSGLDNQTRSLVLSFVMGERPPPELADLVEAKRGWLKNSYSTLPFWNQGVPVRSHPIDGRFMERLLSIYGPLKHELLEWPLEQFHAIDLLAFLDALPEDRRGKGPYLITANIRSEKRFWKLDEIAPYQPVIVIGMDDEKNMFRLSVFYRMSREYSWKAGPDPPVMARPLGAFIYFLKEPPPEFKPQSAQYALTAQSFHLIEKDPLGAIRRVPKGVFAALTFRNGCVYCHEFRGVGSRSHHVVASSGTRHGGFALPLEEYSAEVWKAFVYRQHEVADKIGAVPNAVDENIQDELYHMLVEARDAYGSSKSPSGGNIK